MPGWYSVSQQSSSMRRSALVAVLGALLATGCGGDRTDAATRFVAIDSATTLEIVDWGGHGVPIVFLAGLGHTAHVFDEIAPRLNDSHHVLGITRRGFGASSQPDSGYDVPTLAEDIRTVLDSLDIDRAILAGHSLGGDEMTECARGHPDRIAALIYIDAAYNRVMSRDSMARYAAPASEVSPPTATDSASATAFRSYYARANGVTMPVSEIVAMNRWTPDGRLIGGVTPMWIYDRIVESLEGPDYSGVDVPALAIYGTDYPVTELFLDYDRRDSVTQAAMRTYHEASLRVAALSREYFRGHMPQGRVVEIRGAGHSLYITHQQETLAAIRRFLADVR